MAALKLGNVWCSPNLISTKARKVNPALAAWTFKADQLFLSFCSTPPAQMLRVSNSSALMCWSSGGPQAGDTQGLRMFCPRPCCAHRGTCPRSGIVLRTHERTSPICCSFALSTGQTFVKRKRRKKKQAGSCLIRAWWLGLGHLQTENVQEPWCF